MGPELIAIISAIRALTPELLGLVNDLGTLSDGGEISADRLRELKERGTDLNNDLDALIALRESEED